MKESLEEVFGRELFEGEELLWCGRPQASVRLFQAHIGVVLVAIVVFGGISVLTGWKGALGLLFFGVFILLVVIEQGISVLQTGYGITGQRIILFCGWRGKDIASIMLDRIDGAYLKHHEAGRGNIHLGSWLKIEPYYEGRRRRCRRSSDSGGPPILRSIDDARAVYDLIVSLMMAERRM